MDVRPMEARDGDVVRALFQQLSGHALSAAEMQDRLGFVNASPIDWLFVCEVEGQVRGVLAFRLRERIAHVSRYGEISLIVTDESARRQGVGRTLMDFAEDFARQHDCCGMFPVSGTWRQDEAHRFYQRLGYQATGVRFVKLFGEEHTG